MRGALRDGVEAVGLVEPAGDLVVITANDDHLRKLLNALDDSIRIGAVPDDIAKDERTIVAADARVREAGVERLLVGVNVGQDEIPH